MNSYFSGCRAIYQVDGSLQSFKNSIKSLLYIRSKIWSYSGVTLRPKTFFPFMKTIFCDSRSQGEVHLYADDTTAFRIGNSTDGVVGKLNLLFEEIHTWSELKKLTLHTGKRK